MTTKGLFGLLSYRALTLLVAAAFASSAWAQQSAPSAGPAANQSSSQSSSQPGASQNSNEKGNPKGADPPGSDPKAIENNPKNDRILLVIPNYATVENPTPFSPISVKQKFKLGAEDSFDPYSFLIAGILAGVAQAQDEDAAWGRGWEGFGKRYAAGFVDAADGSFMTTGLFPSIFHEDPRYFRKGSGGFWSRSGYAVKRLLVTRTDSDRNQFNISEFGGNAAAAAISLTYHSEQDRNFSSFASNWADQILIDFIANQAKEFWPDVRHRFLKR